MRHRMKAQLVDFFYVYDTPRTVVVRDKKVGITSRLIQLGVLCYIVGWVFIYEKGYQSEDTPISSISVKLKGIALVDVPGQGSQLLDPADYVFPPEGDNDFVVMTNFIVTPNQTQGICAELPDAGRCNNDADCVKGVTTRQGQGKTTGKVISTSAILKTCPNIAESSDLLRGVMTGRCISFDNTTKTCEVHAWCPIENDSDVPKPPLLLKAENFTLYLKNSISFPRFGATRRNLVESITSNHLLTCVFDKNTDPLCPVMQLGYMVKESGQNFTDIAYKGGTVGVIIDWQCDLDWARKFCSPTYTFVGLDDPASNVSKGFNFRYAKYYVENGVNKRSLYKVFGIRFAVMVSGKAGKFDIIPTMTTIGSGIGIFGVATVVCDLMLLHVIPRRHYYKKRKFKSALEDSQKPTGKKDCDGPCNSFQGDHEEKEHPESTGSAET